MTAQVYISEVHTFPLLFIGTRVAQLQYLYFSEIDLGNILQFTHICQCNSADENNEVFCWSSCAESRIELTGPNLHTRIPQVPHLHLGIYKTILIFKAAEWAQLSFQFYENYGTPHPWNQSVILCLFFLIYYLSLLLMTC